MSVPVRITAKIKAFEARKEGVAYGEIKAVLRRRVECNAQGRTKRIEAQRT